MLSHPLKSTEAHQESYDQPHQPPTFRHPHQHLFRTMIATILTTSCALAMGAALQNPQAALNTTVVALDLISDALKKIIPDLPSTYPHVSYAVIPIAFLIAVSILAYTAAPGSSHRLVTATIGYFTMSWLHSVNFVLVSIRTFASGSNFSASDVMVSLRVWLSCALTPRYFTATPNYY